MTRHTPWPTVLATIATTMVIALAGCSRPAPDTTPPAPVTLAPPGDDTTTDPTTGTGGDQPPGGGVAGVGGSAASGWEVWGVPNPGQDPTAHGVPTPPPGGTDPQVLSVAEQTARRFVSTFFTFGAGDVSPVDSYRGAMGDVDPQARVRLQADMDDMSSGRMSIRAWTDAVDAGVRTTTVVDQVWWADWSHPDSCVAAVVYRQADKPYPGGDWPPFVRPQVMYVTLTQAGGWLVSDWSTTGPVGWVAPAV